MRLSLETIILFVQDVDKLKSFYTDTLQLTLLEETKAEWVLLQAGAAAIGLHKIGTGYADDKNGTFKFDNNTKIVFDVDEDIHKLREDLLNKNVPVKEIKTFDNYDFWVCDGEDPEGNVFQLKQRKK